MSVELSENIQKHLELIGSLQKPLGKTENDSETREVEKDALDATAPKFPPEPYYVVAFFTWGVPDLDGRIGMCRRLESRDNAFKYLAREDVKKIQDWLVTDEIKKYPELEEWVKWVRSLKRTTTIYELDDYPEWLRNILGRLLDAAITAMERTSVGKK